jgi:hypothetical protein
MTRTHRQWHAWLWLFLSPILLTGFIVGAWTRRAPVIETPRLSPPRGVQKSSTEPQPGEVVP